jgi:hypothetical protein
MYGSSVVRQFQTMGARARITLAGLRFEIDIIADRFGDLFDVRIPLDGSVIVRVPDVEKRGRQLLLATESVTQNWRQKFLCGHDERDWFVAALPQKPEAGSVREAFEALKPRGVLREQERVGVARRQRQRRRTTAYSRQGEWFFVPRPDVVVVAKNVRHNDVLVRDGGTPHVVEWLYRPGGRDALFARGTVQHPDHESLRLEQWHQVFRNREAQPIEQAVSQRMRVEARPWKVRYVD